MELPPSHAKTNISQFTALQAETRSKSINIDSSHIYQDTKTTGNDARVLFPCLPNTTTFPSLETIIAHPVASHFVPQLA